MTPVVAKFEDCYLGRRHHRESSDKKKKKRKQNCDIKENGSDYLKREKCQRLEKLKRPE